MIHEYMIHIVPTGSTNTLGYMWLHWHTYSLNHKTPLMYMDIAGLAVISYDMYFMWGCHLWWLWGEGVHIYVQTYAGHNHMLNN